MNRTAIKRAVQAALQELAEERLRDYMETYDSAPENWEDATPENIRTDVLEGTWRFLDPVLTEFYISPARDAYIQQVIEAGKKK